jgi:hypothetical protein
MEKMNRFWIATLLVLISVWPALALAPSAPSSLLTAPTHWDQRAVWDQQGDRVIDSRDGRIQCVAMMSEGPYPGAPEEAARAFLAAHADWLKFTATKDNLRVARIMESPMGYHVTFVRVVNGVPVYPGDMVITLDREKIVRFYFSSLYLVPDNTSTLAALGPSEAIRAAYDYLKPTGQPRDPAQTDLVIWAGDNRDFAACWRVRQFMEDPMGDWEVLVDAQSGTIRRVADRACSVDGQGYVHDPDPLTSAGANYGDTGFTDNNDANSTQLQAQRVWVTLRDITYSGGVYSLQGPWVTLLDWEAPWGAPVTSATANGFGFTRDAQGFEDVMVYYQIDKSQRWMQSLGFYNIQYGAIACDPHGFNGADNSHYIPGTNRIAYGEGGVDDAEDADVILHEYGHAITNSIVPGWGGGDEPSMGEGFGDYWAASYSRSLYAFHSDWVYNWDGHNPFWGGRVVNNNYHYPEDMRVPSGAKPAMRRCSMSADRPPMGTFFRPCS